VREKIITRTSKIGISTTHKKQSIANLNMQLHDKFIATMAMTMTKEIESNDQG
jgi:hypothetical protein